MQHFGAMLTKPKKEGMMHQKKIAKLKKFLHKNLLHSIPICKIKDKLINKSYNKSNKLNRCKLNATTSCATAGCTSACNKSTEKLLLHHNFSRLSYSIPLLSSLALLMVLGLSFAPDFIENLTKTDKASALNVVAESDVPVDYITTYNSGSSLTITPATTGGHGASVDAATTVNPGSVAYRSHDVNVHIEDATSYALQITYSYGKTNLSLEGGNTVYTDVPAAGVVGKNMAQGTWGFAWGATNAVDADMTYYKVPQFNQSGTGIANGGLEVGEANGVVDFTKKLVFGASFTPNAIAGHYTTSVLLSLSANAKDITKLSELTTMQGITPEICSNSPFDNQEYNLTDLRNISTKYKVTRLSNGDCWMTQNLVLDLNGKTLTPADSNVTSNWVSNTSEPIFWNNSESDKALSRYWDGKSQKQTKSTSTTTDYTSKYKSEYGYYYTWAAATVGQGNNITTGGTNITQDICPKGWRLPTRDDYVATIGTNPYNGAWNSTSASYVMNTTMGSKLTFPAAGFIGPSFSTPYNYVGTYGYYWSSTVFNNTNAYVFDFTSSNTYPQNNSARFIGMPVRCIAKRQGEA